MKFGDKSKEWYNRRCKTNGKTKGKKEKMREFENTVCKLLKMKSVPVKYISRRKMEEMCKSDNTEACYVKDINTVFMVKKSKYTTQDYYLLAHELRHAWQQKTNPEYYDNKNSSDLTEDEYNSSKGEIDANAFACIAIAIICKKIVRRTYENDEVAQEKYWKRLEELKLEYGIDF